MLRLMRATFQRLPITRCTAIVMVSRSESPKRWKGPRHAHLVRKMVALKGAAGNSGRTSPRHCAPVWLAQTDLTTRLEAHSCSQSAACWANGDHGM